MLAAVSEPSAVTDIDALFRLPLGEFTSARNALSAQLKKDGRAAEAGEVKELAKPSISAWVVNQLYWQHRELFDRLLEAGERLRRAQLRGDSARDAVTARRDALAGLVIIAETLLRDGGYGATRDMLRRVTTTLEALSSFGSAPGAPAVGRIVDDVEPPGFEALAGLLAGGRSRAASDQIPMPLPKPATKPPQRPERADTVKAREAHKRLLAAAKAALRDAERAAGAARKQAERAGAALDAAGAHAHAAQREREQLERQLASATKALAAAQERARKAASGADEAAAAAESAERALKVARGHLEQVASKRT
jgi:hypothetical protein